MREVVLEVPRGVRVVPASDAAALLEVADTRSSETLDAVHALFFAIEQANPAWLVDLRPAYTSVLVEFDPLQATLDDVRALLAVLPAHVTRARAPNTHTIAVRYGAGAISDLEEIAAASNLTVREVIERHTASRFVVAFLGFMPGFAYLDGLDARLSVARRAAPRARVPQGGVAIAAGQAAVYPQEGPGGWQILGITDVDMGGLALDLGDEVRFVEAP
jgi:KipI family sensor histidine kinase inhibitor